MRHLNKLAHEIVAAVGEPGTPNDPARSAWMGDGEFDLEQALRCARLNATLYQPKTPPRRLLDHLDQLENLARSSAYGTQTSSDTTESEHDLIGAHDAACILGCSARYVRRIHADLDGRQIAGRWVFDRKTVNDYALHRNRNSPTSSMAS